MTSPELCKRRDRLPLISPSACGVNIKITHPWSAAQRFADLVCFPLRNPDGIVVQRQLPRPTAHQQQKPWGCRLQRSANPEAASHGKKQLWRAQALPDQLPKVVLRDSLILQWSSGSVSRPGLEKGPYDKGEQWSTPVNAKQAGTCLTATRPSSRTN